MALAFLFAAILLALGILVLMACTTEAIYDFFWSRRSEPDE
jgi:hypothetical protein